MVKPEPWENPMLDTMWSFMQMGGLKKTVPGTDIPCKIKDWKADKEILFKDVGENN